MKFESRRSGRAALPSLVGLAVLAAGGLAVYVGCQSAGIGTGQATATVTTPVPAPALAGPDAPAARHDAPATDPAALPTITIASAAPTKPATPGAAPAPTTAPAVSTSTAAYPFPVVELRGTGDELGRAHGQRMSTQIRTLHDSYLAKFLPAGAKKFLALTAADRFRAQLSLEHAAEVAAMAAGSGLDPREAMLGQCFLDLAPMAACSTLSLPADAAPDGVARFSRNLDFPSLNVADKYSTLFVVRPDDGRYAFASVGWPGMVGVLSGMNEHGLAIANMEVTRGPRLPQAMPYTLLYRTILERCRTTDEALALLRDTPRQTSNNLMIMDSAGDRAVAEISPEGVTVRRPDEFALISTNHRRSTDNASPGRCGRYDYLRDGSERHFGRIDVARLRSMLATVSQGKATLQSMVFEPSTRVLYLSTGTNAAKGTFHRIDLKEHFRKE